MRLNELTAVATSSVLLVPYKPSHVATYHSWMQDAVGCQHSEENKARSDGIQDLRQATASELLSIDEEYEMQTSWRYDEDKLTFISCLSRLTEGLEPSCLPIVAGRDDSPDRMLGDVNLFLTAADDGEEGEDRRSAEESHGIVGELELMIASADHQRKGFGRATLEAFLQYIAVHESEIVGTFTNGLKMPDESKFSYLRVRIGEDNERSLGLFERSGFLRTGNGASWFGEIELRCNSWRNRQMPDGWRELPYAG